MNRSSAPSGDKVHVHRRSTLSTTHFSGRQDGRTTGRLVASSGQVPRQVPCQVPCQVPRQVPRQGQRRVSVGQGRQPAASRRYRSDQLPRSVMLVVLGHMPRFESFPEAKCTVVGRHYPLLRHWRRVSYKNCRYIPKHNHSFYDIAHRVPYKVT